MKVFLSYRRADTAQIAGRVFDRLASAYGRENVFKDVDSIALGSDFRKAIEDALSRSDAMIVMIGRHWLEATSGAGRRLDDATDLVRLEIEGALAKQLLVIPILVDGAEMPPAVALPTCLQELAFRNGSVVRNDPDFHRDMDRVVRSISHEAPGRDARSHTDENRHPTIESGFQLRALGGPIADTVYRLRKVRLIGGRATSCDIVLLHEPYCSRVAFALEWQSGQRTFCIQPTAANPVLVNDRAVGRDGVLLVSGDCIRLGATVLKYETVT